MNSANFLLVTSYSETGPLVVKEAMACNLPIVSTNVGDVSYLINEIRGCYLTKYAPKDVAEKIKLAIDYSITDGKTNGRSKIIELGLGSDVIAEKIINVYNKTLNIS